MKRGNCEHSRSRSRAASLTRARTIGLAAIWIALAPIPASGQSAWPSYPNNGTISVTSGGNVGIGTPNPGYNLDVNGTSHFTGIMKVPPTMSGNGIGPYADTALWNNAQSAGIQIGVNGAGGGWDRLVALFSGNTVLYVSPNNVYTNVNVGIGTTSPQHMLHVAGTIGAEEVLITSTGADYVFQPGYRLRPLSEVASYIQANHHLPDIPSADEVKAKGMGVGEMETKLLSKIEELTLHMIEADKRIAESDARNLRLEEHNRQLQDRISGMEHRAAIRKDGAK